MILTFKESDVGDLNYDDWNDIQKSLNQFLKEVKDGEFEKQTPWYEELENPARVQKRGMDMLEEGTRKNGLRLL